MVDAGGNVSAEARWDAFGEVRSGGVSSAVAGGGFGLHGMWLDEGTRLYYVRARTYDARTGRFLSRDPVAGVAGRPESMNPYVANHSNPVIYVDPSGAFSLGELSAVTAIIGVLSSIAMPAFANFKFPARTAGGMASTSPQGRKEVLERLHDVGAELTMVYSVSGQTLNVYGPWGLALSIHAESGKYPSYTGRSEFENVADKGPIPRGVWYSHPSELDDPGPIWDTIRNFASILGGKNSGGDWGDWRLRLYRAYPATTPGNRDQFFIHGGSRPGTGGCIDVGGGVYGNADTDYLKCLLQSDGDDTVYTYVH